MKREAIGFFVVFTVLSSFAIYSWSQESAPIRLTLQEAIEKGLQANLSVLVADSRVQELEGTRVRRLANLLPKVRTQAYANLQNRNLRAFGISFPGVPEVVGPFSNYDFRVYADQSIVDLQSYRNYRAATLQAEAGKLDYQEARDLVIRSVAALYLNAQSAAARVNAAQSRVTLSEALYRLAKDKHDARPRTVTNKQFLPSNVISGSRRGRHWNWLSSWNSNHSTDHKLRIQSLPRF